MPEFLSPPLPADLPAEALSLQLRSTFTLSEDEAAALREDLGEDFTGHVSLREATEFAGESAELHGMIGIHERRSEEVDLFESVSTYWVHYNLTLTSGVKAEAKRSRQWDQVAASLANFVSPRPVDVNAFWVMPKDRVTFSVALPIPLEGDIPGFAEIRGVRLSQPDPESPDDDLYSLILNYEGSSASVQVRAALESCLDSDVLVTAMERAFSIAKRAMEYTKV